MYWLLWLVLMIAIPVLAGIPLWRELGASVALRGEETEGTFQAEDRYEA